MTRLTLLAALAVLSACANTATGPSVVLSENSNAMPISVVRDIARKQTTPPRPVDWCGNRACVRPQAEVTK